MDDVLARLKALKVFKQLSEDDLREIAKLVERERWVTGEVLFQQGSPGDALYIIERGQLMVRVVNVRGMEQVVAYLQPGQYLGETSLLTGEEHDATVQALEDTELFTLTKAKFDRLLTERPHIRDLLDVSEKTREKLAARDFPGRAEGEVSLIFKRKHWIVLLRTVTLPIVTFLISLIMVWATYRFGLFDLRIALAAIVLFIMLGLWAAWYVIDWVNDHYIVTNKRVIHIEQVLFLYEERREAPLSSVQNVNVVTPGPVASSLNYDNLIVETAGEAGNIVFAAIPNARQVREVIFEQTRRMQALAGLDERRRVRDGIRQQLQRAMGGDYTKQPGGPPPPPKKPQPQPAGASPQPAKQTTMGRREGALLRMLRDFFPPMWDEGKDRITWRKHWFIFFRKAWLPMISFAGVLVLLGIVLLHLPPFDRLSWRVELGIVIPLVLAVGFGLWFRLEDWKNDIYVVTDNALLDIEKLPLRLREESKQASLGVVQDVTYTIPHPIAQLFNFGHVYIETAGPTGRLTFQWVSNPREVQREIFRRMEAFRARQQRQQAVRRWEELMQWFGVYHELVSEQPGDGEPG